MKYFAILVSSFLFSSYTFAQTNAAPGQVWYGPYTVAKVARYWDGGHRMSVHVVEAPKASCAVTNNEKKASYYL